MLTTKYECPCIDTHDYKDRESLDGGQEETCHERHMQGRFRARSETAT